VLLPIVVPLDAKMDRLLQRGSSSILYRIVGALILCSSIKETLKKYATSLSVNALAIHPSAIALLPTIGLRYLRAL
jgi:hypothetical protein